MLLLSPSSTFLISEGFKLNAPAKVMCKGNLGPFRCVFISFLVLKIKGTSSFFGIAQRVNKDSCCDFCLVTLFVVMIKSFLEIYESSS